MFSILITAHFVACIWHYVGTGSTTFLGLDANGQAVEIYPWVVARCGALTTWTTLQHDGPNHHEL